MLFVTLLKKIGCFKSENTRFRLFKKNMEKIPFKWIMKAHHFLVRPTKKPSLTAVESSRNMTAHGDAREGKWRGNWRMEWVAITLHTALEHAVPSVTTADERNSAASSRLNWRPRRFKWIRPFRRKTKSGFCAGAITFYWPLRSQLAW
jgi:hypothetical protein